MSSANRARRLQNRETKLAAAEEHLRRTKRQRITFAAVGLGLAIVVGVVLVARAKSDNSGTKAASSPTTTVAPPSTIPSVAGKPCVAMKGKLPAGAPPVPVKVGPPPKKLLTQDLQVGTGAVVNAKATVTVDYIGVACSTGTIFDSSYSRNQPFTTKLGQVVEGWQQGIPGIRVGGSRLLGIPPALGYGSNPPAGISPGETLWFVVKALKTS